MFYSEVTLEYVYVLKSWSRREGDTYRTTAFNKGKSELLSTSGGLAFHRSTGGSTLISRRKVETLADSAKRR